MPETPTIAPEAAVDKPAEHKFDPFHPEMPKIPGVSQEFRRENRGAGGMDSRRLLQIGSVVAAVVLIGAVTLWLVARKPRAAAGPPSGAEVTEPAAPAALPPSARAPLTDGPTQAASLEELSKPWTAKKFTFVKYITRENIDAMVIRLPGGGLWAFSLQEPASRCALEFVKDLPTLASKFGFRAAHPMVVSPCDGTVYDPLKLGELGGNTWVRGEIVQGSGLRPPIAIEVKVRGRFIVADSIE